MSIDIHGTVQVNQNMSIAVADPPLRIPASDVDDKVRTIEKI